MDDVIRLSLFIPFDKMKMSGQFRSLGKVTLEEYTENGLTMEVLLRKKYLHLAEPFII